MAKAALGRLSPSTLVSLPIIHSTNCATVITIYYPGLVQMASVLMDLLVAFQEDCSGPSSPTSVPLSIVSIFFTLKMKATGSSEMLTIGEYHILQTVIFVVTTKNLKSCKLTKSLNSIL
jgi:hypothetical protein